MGKSDHRRFGGGVGRKAVASGLAGNGGRIDDSPLAGEDLDGFLHVGFGGKGISAGSLCRSVQIGDCYSHALMSQCHGDAPPDASGSSRNDSGFPP